MRSLLQLLTAGRSAFMLAQRLYRLTGLRPPPDPDIRARLDDNQSPCQPFLEADVAAIWRVRITSHSAMLRLSKFQAMPFKKAAR